MRRRKVDSGYVEGNLQPWTLCRLCASYAAPVSSMVLARVLPVGMSNVCCMQVGSVPLAVHALVTCGLMLLSENVSFMAFWLARWLAAGAWAGSTSNTGSTVTGQQHWQIPNGKTFAVLQCIGSKIVHC